MRQVRLKTYEDCKIFVMQHGLMFQYWFSRGGEMYMQWGVHKPGIQGLLMALVGLLVGKKIEDTAFTSEERQAISEAYVQHAIRSIDHIIDPTSKHCIHNAKVKGENAALCAVCNKSGDRV